MIPAIVALIAIILESWSSLLKSLDLFLKSKQLTVGAILTGMVPFFVIWNKMSKEKDKRIRAQRVEKRQLEIEQRQLRIESKIDDLMHHVGVESTWSLPISGSEITRIRTSITLYTLLRTVRNHLKQRRVSKMKAYLKKLGKTKFQAFLIITFTNIIMLIGSVTGWVDIDGKINEWMPAINVIVQLIATLVYTAVEGSIDKASIKATGQEYTTGGATDAKYPADTDSAV